MITTQYVTSSRLRELQWSIDWWAKVYAESGENASRAWALVDDAIENNEPHQHIQALREVAQMFDDIRKDAWTAWDNAKAQYLALHN